ncbi:uncharacterized protein LOC134409568 [Elgaria multicarinata webbii]|uniref:uncharacterized protein LOC134409568 n=1 Tax=Elgaria multicarinata webbii TaxID=159646 RepID=UPI002FCCD339
MQPTAVVHISSESMDNSKAQEPAESIEIESAKEEEEKTLNDLVGLLQDMVKNIPTKQAEAPPLTEGPTIMISNIEPSPSETADTVWVNMKPKADEMKIEPLETVVLTETAPTTTAFWKLRNDASASVILHSDTTTSEKASLEDLQSETTASVLFSDSTTPEKTLVSVSLLMETDTTTGKSKSFDELTNGALASLVESLKNVKKLHVTLHKISNKPQDVHIHEKTPEAHQPAGADILELIDTLILTIKNAPSPVKEDPALHKYIEKAESFLKNALELAAAAEKKLVQEKQENKLELEIRPSPRPSPPVTLPVSEVTIQLIPSSTEPLAKKAEDAQVEMGKLKAFINLLYGFSPHLTSYAQNSPSQKIAEDIVERALAVLDAIKSIFCGNPEGRSKQMLKQLLKEDMELVRQAMNERIS